MCRRTIENGVRVCVCACVLVCVCEVAAARRGNGNQHTRGRREHWGLIPRAWGRGLVYRSSARERPGRDSPVDILLKCLGASLVPQSNTCPLEYEGGGAGESIVATRVGESVSVVFSVSLAEQLQTLREGAVISHGKSMRRYFFVHALRVLTPWGWGWRGSRGPGSGRRWWRFCGRTWLSASGLEFTEMVKKQLFLYSNNGTNIDIAATMLKLLTLAVIVGVAAASCPNKCSGHGQCSTNDKCACYSNYQGSDCSMRKCGESLEMIELEMIVGGGEARRGGHSLRTISYLAHPRSTRARAAREGSSSVPVRTHAPPCFPFPRASSWCKMRAVWLEQRTLCACCSAAQRGTEKMPRRRRKLRVQVPLLPQSHTASLRF